PHPVGRVEGNAAGVEAVEEGRNLLEQLMLAIGLCRDRRRWTPTRGRRCALARGWRFGRRRRWQRFATTWWGLAAGSWHTSDGCAGAGSRSGPRPWSDALRNPA